MTKINPTDHIVVNMTKINPTDHIVVNSKTIEVLSNDDKVIGAAKLDSKYCVDVQPSILGLTFLRSIFSKIGETLTGWRFVKSNDSTNTHHYVHIKNLEKNLKENLKFPVAIQKTRDLGRALNKTASQPSEKEPQAEIAKQAAAIEAKAHAMYSKSTQEYERTQQAAARRAPAQQTPPKVPTLQEKLQAEIDKRAPRQSSKAKSAAIINVHHTLTTELGKRRSGLQKATLERDTSPAQDVEATKTEMQQKALKKHLKAGLEERGLRGTPRKPLGKIDPNERSK